MARVGRPKYTPEELEIIRNSVVRNGDTSYVPREVYRQIERARSAGGDPGFTQPGGGPDKFNPGRKDRGSNLDHYQKLIGRLEKSRVRRGGTWYKRGTGRRTDGRMSGPKGRDRFKKPKGSANASPESFEAFRQAVSNARQVVQTAGSDALLDLRSQEANTSSAHPLAAVTPIAAVTPNETKSIERKIKGYLGERPVYEDERIDFTGTGWEIL